MVPRVRLTLLLACVLIAATAALAWRRPVHREAMLKRATNTRVRVNVDDAATLRLLPGVGNRIADHILERRDTVGPLRTAADLDAVPWVGPRTIKRIEPFVSYDGGHEVVRRAQP